MLDSSTKDHREIEITFYSQEVTLLASRGHMGMSRKGANRKISRGYMLLLEFVGTVLWGSQARSVNSNKKRVRFW